MSGPSIVFDVAIGETWWMLKPQEREAVMQWMREQGFPRAARVEVYADHAMVHEYDPVSSEDRVHRIAITSQPPTRLDGR